MNYHEIWLKTIRVAQNLQKRGFHSPHVFTFMVNQADDLIPIVLASFCLACPINPLHASLKMEEIERVLVQTRPSVVFCKSDTFNWISKALDEMNLNAKIFTFGEKIDGIEPVENLFIETNEEIDFV